MTKKEARSVAVNFIYNCKNVAYESLIKYSIDDNGTLSNEGYDIEDYNKIEKEIDFILDRILKYELK